MMISQSNIFIVPGRQDRTSHHVIKVLVDTLSTWSKAYVVGPVVHIGIVGMCPNNISQKRARMFFICNGKIIFSGFSLEMYLLLLIFLLIILQSKPMHSKN